MNRGLFISFEGGEGCGKTTQIQRLRDVIPTWLPCEVIALREPGGCYISERIRHLVKHDPEAVDMCSNTELLLFAAARAQLVDQVIRPALQRGALVLADRFTDSTLVYQGAGRGIPPHQLHAICSIACGECNPDLTLLFDQDPAIGEQRIRRRGDGYDRMHGGPEFHASIRRAYQSLAAENTHRISVIDSSRPLEDVSAAVDDIILRKLKQWQPTNLKEREA